MSVKCINCKYYSDYITKNHHLDSGCLYYYEEKGKAPIPVDELEYWYNDVPEWCPRYGDGNLPEEIKAIINDKWEWEDGIKIEWKGMVK